MPQKIYTLQHQYTTLPIELLKNHKSFNFIETGTNSGLAVKQALLAGFKNIYTIDLESWLDTTIFSDMIDDVINSNICYLSGDSQIVLPILLKYIKHKSTFWLDAHSNFNNPLLHELDIIAKHSIKNHTILIDDMRMTGTPEWQHITEDDIRTKLLTINPGYNIIKVDSNFSPSDILCAFIQGDTYE